MNTSSLDLPEQVPCPFCDYLAGVRPYTILRRSALTATLVTREQRGMPHVLVLPIRHATSVLDLEDHEASALILEVRDVAAQIDRSYGRPGIAIWQNNGEPAAQAIAHVHFHVAGTLPGGGTEFGEVPEISVEATDAIAARIRAQA
jgi:histidine triad (HIT) family protein